MTVLKQKGIWAVVILILLLAGAAGYYWFAKNTKQTEREPSQVFASQSECERTTNTKCDFRTCDSVPKGKSSEEVCGKDFRKGWVSVEDLGSDTEYIARGTVLDINLEPLSRDGDGMLALRSGDGKRVKVAFPAGEFGGCKRPFTVMDILNRVAVGDTVEVSGEVRGFPFMVVTVCSSEKHHLKIIGKEIPTSTTGNPVCGNGVCEAGESECMPSVPQEQLDRYPTGGSGASCQPNYCPQDCQSVKQATGFERSCAVDQDCVLVRPECGCCPEPVAINTRYKDVYEFKYEKERKDPNCVACGIPCVDTVVKEARCESGLCTAKPVTPRKP